MAPLWVHRAPALTSQCSLQEWVACAVVSCPKIGRILIFSSIELLLHFCTQSALLLQHFSLSCFSEPTLGSRCWRSNLKRSHIIVSAYFVKEFRAAPEIKHLRLRRKASLYSHPVENVLRVCAKAAGNQTLNQTLEK